MAQVLTFWPAPRYVCCQYFFCRFSDGLVAGFICLGGEFLGQIDLGKI
jgi:hypothetical protein